MRIRDPIHGTLPVSADEAAVVDSVWYQRLRHVRQLGFGELAFPGATHTRHAHSLGAMHVVGRLFDSLAALVTGRTPPGGLDFRYGDADWAPLLRALVSGELDADRMDYLLRDSFYTGVNYGRFDLDWLVQNLHPAERDGQVELALSRSAVLAFEDFLLSRHHMFLSVYLHHTAVSFDWMLEAYYREAPEEFQVPADPDRFLRTDDVALLWALRNSPNRWAQRIVRRQELEALAQFTERDKGYDLAALSAALTQAGVEHFTVESRETLSRYFEEGEGPSLYVLDESSGRLTPVARYTPCLLYTSP